MKKKETKIQELERRIVELEKARVVTIIHDYSRPASNQPVYPLVCTCNYIYTTPTRPPCPVHGSGGQNGGCC